MDAALPSARNGSRTVRGPSERAERAVLDLGVVGVLVDDPLAPVVTDVVAADVEPGLVGVDPDADAEVVVDGVAGDRALDGDPELAPTRAAALLCRSGDVVVPADSASPSQRPSSAAMAISHATQLMLVAQT